jgi:hypothetical protein
VKQPRFDDFKRNNTFLERNGQIHVLPVNGLEDYYPTEIRNRFAQITDKVKLAKAIAKEISKDAFEQEMAVIFGALEHCWNCSYTD